MTDDSKWKRKLPTRIYDYNYKVGESYYNPQTQYIDERSYLPTLSKPPQSQTYAERFANKPWYGGVKGLPYDTTQSALSQPLVNRRAVSTSRASSIMKDREEDVPSHIRVRRRTKTIEDEVSSENKYKEKPKRYHYEEETDYKPSLFTKELRRDIEKLTEEIKAPAVRRSSIVDLDYAPSRTSVSYEVPEYSSELGLAGIKSISKSKSSYTMPASRTKVSKSSYTESKSYDSARPPSGLGGRSRKISFTDSEPSLDLAPRGLRSRKVSLDEFSYRPPRNLDSLKQDDYDLKVSAKELRDMRRAKESDELTEKIRGSISRMRASDIDKEAAYKYTREMRASSLDPFGDDKYGAKQRSVKFRHFVYGVGK